MKHFILFVCAFLVSTGTFAQTPYGREKVIEVDTVTSAEVLQSIAHKWFVDTFKNANEVIQMNDAGSNTIVGKGWSPFGDYGAIWHTVEVVCKKGRARIRVYNVDHKGIGNMPMFNSSIPAPTWGAIYDQEKCYNNGDREKRVLNVCAVLRPETDKILDGIVASFEKAIRTPSAVSTDW